KEFRARFHIPISDDEIGEAPFYKPADDSRELNYLRQRRKDLGGFLPARVVEYPPVKAPGPDFTQKYVTGTSAAVSATMCFGDMWRRLRRKKDMKKLIVPIMPEEPRPFGMDGLFKAYGIYSNVGQLYEPVDAKTLLAYREAKDGQILEEGITE